MIEWVSHKLRNRRLFVLAFDIALAAFAFILAFYIRFDFMIPDEFRAAYHDGLIAVLLVKPVIFIFSGLYRNLWRYASLQDGIEILKVVTISSITTVFLLMYYRHFAPYPRSIFILDWVFLFALMASSRLVWRVIREIWVLPRLSVKGRRTLIIGAGEAGSLLVKEIKRQNASPYELVGLVDDDLAKVGLRLHGLTVLGTTAQLKEIIRKFEVEYVIIAIPSAGSKAIRDIINACERSKINFKILPGISQIIDGEINISLIKDVVIEDLLGRDVVKLDETAIRSYLQGKCVLVSGAAGSIGSEICRQVSRFLPGKLVLFEIAETPLFFLEKELVEACPDLRIVPVIGDVRCRERVEAVFEEFMPDVVFHAAAYKHVVMMEYNPAEAVMNNVFGTKVIVDAARRFKVDNFVMISTDKAVNPTNVMGASKRAAELYIQAMANHNRTKFTTVRFGNVLGSNGSVIPIFKEQIRNGGPVTVTDPEVVRYFMTIPEASQLVLQAGCLGNGGDIFVLDMGQPVKIVELAEELIKLSGLTPYEDIDIKFTGMRPGEKLFEELFITGEGIRPTTHDKIKIVEAVASEPALLGEQLEQLFTAARQADMGAIKNRLENIVAEYRPSSISV